MATKTAQTNSTKLLLTGAALAGPLYVGLAIFQMAIREGYDPTRHDVSLMSNGDLGWIQIMNFLVTGLLVIGGAVALRRILKGGKGGTWGPWMLGLYGLGLIGAGLFVADPMNGFPLGTPAGPPVNPTMHSLLHLVAGSLGFTGLIAACFILARKFNSLKQRGLAWFSRVTGVLFFAAFAGIAGGSQGPDSVVQTVTIGFGLAVLLAWSWITVMALFFKKQG